MEFKNKFNNIKTFADSENEQLVRSKRTTCYIFIFCGFVLSSKTWSLIKDLKVNSIL